MNNEKDEIDLSSVSDDEFIKEMTKRFIVPQFYLKEHIEMWNINEDDFDDFKNFVDTTHLYFEIDDAMKEVAQKFLEQKQKTLCDDCGEVVE